jgi:hypothetical protein
MKPITLTVTGVANSSVAAMNHYVTPFNVGFGTVASGAGNYTVQHTFDDVLSPTFNPATAQWYSHPTVAAITVATATDGNYAFPVTGIRVIGNSGNTGITVTMKIVQAGSAAAS